MKIGVLCISWDYGIGQWSKTHSFMIPSTYSRHQEENLKAFFYPEPLGLFHLNFVQIILG